MKSTKWFSIQTVVNLKTGKWIAHVVGVVDATAGAWWKTKPADTQKDAYSDGIDSVEAWLRS